MKLLDVDELRAELLARLAELFAAPWLDARGTIEPGGTTSFVPTQETSAFCDGARGTIEPPGCGS